MAKILVTGASGFIGFHLIRALLEQGHELSCLVPSRRNSTAWQDCQSAGLTAM